MLEFLLCSLVTIFPDYLYRSRVQGKRWGRELTLFSIWYELRWGITACAVLTISLLTMIFYYHPTTSNGASFFRTVTILPETGGRVAEVYVENLQEVEAGDPLFRLDDELARASYETAKAQVAEIDAAMVMAQSELAAAEGSVAQARSALTQATDELNRNLELQARNSSVVSEREIERQQNLVDGREAALTVAESSRASVQTKISTLLPAQKATAESALAQAQVTLDKLVVTAGVSGTVQQFILQPGDYVSAVLRPAGILVPKASGTGRFQAGFDQVSAQVIKPGMVGEILCLSKPFTIIPTVVVSVQDVIASGQFRPTDRLVDATEAARPGTVTVAMEPLYPGSADDVPPGSKCIVNAYTSFHDRLDEGGLGFGTWIFYHAVDATAVVHAAVLRIQALIVPVQTLVFSGH
ncbi:biotin/lipoyl-binding protein [Defluviimonas sp. WL0024]|uniref:Biotin/lipoyl-binding protein n=2 Tax=Albidovulum TaxID=205889 RepID=A0ABT3IXN8_9RHOB|nr:MULTISPECIES: biotin/lipoyl-binding protein [Defluviimonas]MCU9846639.1 biotin/lipoyl-binding protein [Defluviimonas sp. WL0024]MCW3780210.1 biotin/lipoyl-binding protein [Defluviimonas salinarum]